MLKFTICAAATSLLLVACGGGGGSDPAPVAAQPAEVAVAPVVVTVAPPPAPVVAPAAAPVRALKNDPNKLSAAMQCSGGFGPNSGRAVLLIPGATQTVDSEYSWSYIPAFDKMGIPWCAVDLPNKHTAELQDASEYVTFAIRKMHEITKTKIAVVAFSQGGALGRWSLKYFPDTQGMVEDFIGIAASYSGLIETTLLCAVPVLGCITSFTQIATGAKWMTALNKGGQTFAGIDYTSIYTRTDDVAIPNFNDSGVSSLQTGTGNRLNVATQDICPLNIADHFIAGSFDPVVFALVKDALTFPGTASKARVKGQGLGLCTQLVHPGVDLVTMPINFATKMMLTFATSVLFQPKSTSEPALMDYVTY